MNDRPKIAYLISDGYREAPRKLSDQELEVLLTHYPDTGWEPKLETLRGMIRCEWVERVKLPGLGDLWIDEEGKLKDSTVNPVASALYVASGDWDLIVGMGVLIVDSDYPSEGAVQLIQEAWSRITEYRRVVEGGLN